MKSIHRHLVSSEFSDLSIIILGLLIGVAVGLPMLDNAFGYITGERLLSSTPLLKQFKRYRGLR